MMKNETKTHLFPLLIQQASFHNLNTPKPLSAFTLPLYQIVCESDTKEGYSRKFEYSIKSYWAETCSRPANNTYYW